MNATEPDSAVLRDAEEDDAWDALFDTQALRCCDCPSCNFYLPEDQYKPESTCVVVAAIERIVALRTGRA